MACLTGQASGRKHYHKRCQAPEGCTLHPLYGAPDSGPFPLTHTLSHSHSKEGAEQTSSREMRERETTGYETLIQVQVCHFHECFDFGVLTRHTTMMITTFSGSSSSSSLVRDRASADLSGYGASAVLSGHVPPRISKRGRNTIADFWPVSWARIQ